MEEDLSGGKEGKARFAPLCACLRSLQPWPFLALPASADTITVMRDASNCGAAIASASDPSLASGDISGLTFTPVSTVNEGSFTAPPPGAPAGTIPVQVPPDCGPNRGQSGFIEVLPAAFSDISIAGAANVDDGGLCLPEWF